MHREKKMKGGKEMGSDTARRRPWDGEKVSPGRWPWGKDLKKNEAREPCLSLEEGYSRQRVSETQEPQMGATPDWSEQGQGGHCGWSGWGKREAGDEGGGKLELTRKVLERWRRVWRLLCVRLRTTRGLRTRQGGGTCGSAVTLVAGGAREEANETREEVMADRQSKWWQCLLGMGCRSETPLSSLPACVKKAPWLTT